MNKPKIVVIVGPTAIGKSSLALEIACKISGEIISADSMQVYRHMDIGTAKPTPDEQRKVRHYLIDILSPDEQFSAALFRQKAGDIISSLNKEEKTAIVAGGTGLYIKALTRGLFKGPGTDQELRQTLRERATQTGSESLYRELTGVDPVTAARLHPNDTSRIIRALEVYKSTKRPLSKYHEKHRFKDSPFEAIKIGLYIDRQQLYSRIENRVDRMVAVGLVGEVKSLLDMGYSRDLNSMQGLGYKQITAYLSGELSFDEAISQIKRDTKRYAKRQMTWLRADREIIWHVYPDNYPEILHKIKGFLET